jgi:hypothetical protein
MFVRERDGKKVSICRVKESALMLNGREFVFLCVEMRREGKK